MTDYDYDALGRLVQITAAKGTVDEAVVTFEYDERDRTLFLLNVSA
ncbi:MAG: RHS repeat domain-containing protein [Thermosynechococcaceae cyanobacterium]